MFKSLEFYNNQISSRDATTVKLIVLDEPQNPYEASDVEVASALSNYHKNSLI